MNWIKAVIAGAVGGIVVNIYSGLVHGFIMGSTYQKYAVFAQEMPSMFWFFLVSIMVGIMGAILFAKTRGSWDAGLKGGMMFGFFLGLVAFFAQFYNTLVIKEFPYFLSWCWGGITLIGWVIYGAVFGLLYKETAAS